LGIRQQAMDYKDKIEYLVSKIDKETIDFDKERKRGRKPSTAYSEFLTNRAQGDWAEQLVYDAANSQLKNVVIVKYGMSDRITVGEDGFDEFYDEYQNELDIIGKRPDLLVFKKEDYNENWGDDISGFTFEELNLIVPKAIAGLEIRSSSFIEGEYEKELLKKIDESKRNALKVRDEILSYEGGLLNEGLVNVLKRIDEDNLSNQEFRIQVNNQHESKDEIKEKLRILKEEIKNVQKRDFLSFTPKIEDLSLVYKWIQTYGVPHFYIQVFYDRVYGISFENILKTIAEVENKNTKYYIEKDVKNQMKSTVKINVKDGIKLGENLSLPEHKSAQKVFKRGRVVHFVTLVNGDLHFQSKKWEKLMKK